VESTGSPGRWRVAGWAVIGAASLTAAAWLFLRFTGGPARFAAQVGALDAGRWAVLIPATLAFYSLDWLRYWALFRLLGHPLPYRLGLELVAISYFVSSLTPVAELHLPVMVVVLVGRGYPAGVATAATVAKSVYMVLWVCVLGGIGVRVSPVVVPPAIARNLGYYLVPLAIGIAALAVTVIAPGPIHRWCERRLAGPDFAGWRRRLVAGFDHTVAALTRIGRSRRPVHLVAHGACALFVACYVVIGHVVAGGVGLHGDWGASSAVWSASLMVAYLAPVPGSMGVTETATAYLLDPSLPPAAMSAAVLVRLLCWYLVLAPGAVLLVREARRVGWRRLTSGGR